MKENNELFLCGKTLMKDGQFFSGINSLATAIVLWWQQATIPPEL
jgi:hypothetical protein